MKILCNGPDGDVLGLDVTPQTTIQQIKEMIIEEYGADADFYLTYGTKILNAENARLEDLEIGNMANLNCVGRLIGGKVHGSLARAGKVRNQTPKVEKEEKKKKKRGRAFRREQYTKRIEIKRKAEATGQRIPKPNSQAARA
ncbi:40S ribosomal protein S30 [Aphelenchoides bicaudatus]|nr:40S ribosomal protein S30 [Aphelenchoides bicaudatus]